MQRRTLRTVVVAATTLSLAAALAACGPAASDEPKSLSVGVGPGLFSGLYEPQPSIGVDMTLVYESLMTFDGATRQFEPLLATSFELSDDRKTATLTLRDDVDFSNGEHMDAEGAAAALTAIVQKGTEEVTWFYADYDAQFRATGDYELEITTSIPMNTRAGGALHGIAILPIFPPSFVDNPEALTDAPIGTGPYLLDKVVPEVSASFVRNEDYWNPEGAPFDTVKITTFDDQIAGLNALKSGQVDSVQIPISAAADAEANGFRIHEGAADTMGLWIADRGGVLQPALGDLRVRQAIALAFDREVINDSLNLGYGRLTSQPFAEGTPEYVEGGDDRYGYDPEEARALMAEAGYEDGFDLTIPSTTFLGINAWEPIVIEYLGAIGIRVTFEKFADSGTYFTAALGGTYPVLMYPGSGEIAMDVYYLPTAVFAFHDLYSDPKVDELAETMRNGALDESVQAASDIGEYVYDQAWYTVFAAPNTLWAADPELEFEITDLVTQYRIAD